MNTVRVGLCTGPRPPASAGAAAGLAGADILIFPELADGGYAALRGGASPHSPGDALLRAFAEASQTIAPCCIAGSVYYRPPASSPRNTSLVYRRGRLIHRYDKIHLFRPTGDHRWFHPGRSIGTFRADIGRMRVRCGVMICYDLRFPELARAMARMGMEILFVPARWPGSRDDAWQTLLKARAIENQVFTVGCNATGEEGGWSYAFDPLGGKIFDSHDSPGGAAWTIELDIDSIADARKLHRNMDEAVVLRSAPLLREVSARRRA